MNKKIITFAALAAGVIGVSIIGSQAEAGIVNPGKSVAASGQTSLVAKANYQGRHFKRHNRRVWRHRAVKHRHVWRHKRKWHHHRKYRRGFAYRHGLVGVAIARQNVCARYYNNAVYTGYRYWWNKYDTCIRRTY
ncbi:MAG: hypothetical protein C0605_13185 [Hyphomicrobiales bacterium]|nr:MAG: hypothetical protein C0605_13185 [Hyphomicrobiales bacterium]